MSSDTKIQIWKQFTTDQCVVPLLHALCHPIQRYKFESNSQLCCFHCSLSCGCVIRYKDTNLKAIHNTHSDPVGSTIAVSSDTKIQIWKQFTTGSQIWFYRVMLCHPIQRYKFESNSQQDPVLPVLLPCCVIRYKDTNLKAIHNSCLQSPAWRWAVSSDTKIQIWKQFTTRHCRRRVPLALCHPIQRYKFESNSQQSFKRSQIRVCCVIRYKDTNLKAIHNYRRCVCPRFPAVSSDTKIQIWKQFTTGEVKGVFRQQLCHPIQRYKFESNSQHEAVSPKQVLRCVIRYKDTNLKAIHNSAALWLWRPTAVSSDTKIQIWKQFTTHNVIVILLWLLCHPIQRYKFESNSQHEVA